MEKIFVFHSAFFMFHLKKEKTHPLYFKLENKNILKIFPKNY